MLCIECKSELNLSDQDYCENCGAVPERAFCSRCEKDFPISLFGLHVCIPSEQSSNQNLVGMVRQPTNIEISLDENELLVEYFAIQDRQRELDADRKLILGQLFEKFSTYDFLTLDGEVVGKVMNVEYLALDVELLRLKFPEVYSSCFVKVRHQRYIKRPSRLI